VAPDGAMRVVDYKTGRSPSELFEGKALFQMKFYALVLWRLRGEIPRLLQLVYLGNGEVVRYTPDEHDLLSLERNLKAVWSAIERAALTGDWRPKTSRLCDWCDFRHLCPAWGGTPPPLPDDAAQRALDPVVSGQVAPADD
jgi:putative RecB family exonuclease